MDSLKAFQNASLIFTLSEASTDFIESDIIVSGGTLVNFIERSSTVYTANFYPVDDHTSSTTEGIILVEDTKFSDSFGNTNSDGYDADNIVTFSIDRSDQQLR